MQKIKFSIGFKLICIITVLVLISLGAVTYMVSYFVGDETKRTAEENNHTLNSRSAVSAESELTTIRSNSFLLLDMLSSAGNSNAIARQATTFFFERNQETAAIILYNVETNRNDRTLVNSRFFLSNELDEGMLTTFQNMHKDEIQRSARGEVFVLSG
ncbi:MAG: adenylate/guanylate cyclase domain-containing protein, partial [Spirochaetaceae bacterium]|nr:adenylate/guanylate cyclase domain-containing protein [Spirochaetaceae bacterium]